VYSLLLPVKAKWANRISYCWCDD